MKKQPSDMLSEASKAELESIRVRWDAMRNCTRCNGLGKVEHSDWEQKHNPECVGHMKVCSNCRGVGLFMRPNIIEILNDTCTVQKGMMNLRSARPKFAAANAANRAYYVWRMARFDGGVDVTMPMNALMELCQDPYIRELDSIAGAFAKRLFGTDKAGALRWAPNLGMMSDADVSAYMKKHPQPATAYESGPVLTADKPACERLELESDGDQ